jgi:DNA-binding PucR family transcriptional regulator
MARMDDDMPWFAELSAADRSWVGVIVQAGIKSFVDWYADEERHPELDGTAVAAQVFGAAPRALAGVISLQQTVDLVRLGIEVVETNLEAVLDPADVRDVHAGVLRYGREVAFATAEVYARAAEVRGAWDARLEALVVDSVLRAEADETMLSRASALGWADRGAVTVVLGAVQAERRGGELFDEVRRVARAAGMDALCASQGDRLVVILGGVDAPEKAAAHVMGLFGIGPVVVGPVVDDLGHAHLSARAATSAHRAATGWPEAPRPVRADELLPERALAGDGHARRHLVEEVFLPLLGGRETLVETLSTYFAQGRSLEATARALFCHPNTVRYRLRQVGDVTGLTPTDARDAFTLEIALVLGRQSGRE